MQPVEVLRACGRGHDGLAQRDDDDGFTYPSLADPTASSLLAVASVIMTPPALTGDRATYTISLTDPRSTHILLGLDNVEFLGFAQSMR